jgi:hypothetical protein
LKNPRGDPPRRQPEVTVRRNALDDRPARNSTDGPPLASANVTAYKDRHGKTRYPLPQDGRAYCTFTMRPARRNSWPNTMQRRTR